MKKLFLPLILYVMAVLGASAQYSSLVFTTDKGEELSIPVSNLVITISGENLIAQSDNQKLEIPTNSLTKMQFGDADNTGVANITESVNGPVELYTLEGKSAGSFGTFDAARLALEDGVYIVKLADGNSLKIYIKK